MSQSCSSSFMDIRAPPYAHISSWLLVLCDWPFMGKYVLLRVWVFVMEALCLCRQGCSSCQLPALVLCTWLAFGKEGNQCIPSVFGEECTAACGNDLVHVLSTKNVSRQSTEGSAGAAQSSLHSLLRAVLSSNHQTAMAVRSTGFILENWTPRSTFLPVSNALVMRSTAKFRWLTQKLF